MGPNPLAPIFDAMCAPRAVLHAPKKETADRRTLEPHEGIRYVMDLDGQMSMPAGTPGVSKCSLLAREVERLEQLLPIAEDIERLAPTRAAIEDWFAQTAARWTPNGASNGRRPNGRPFRTTFTLAWDADGAIDFEKSGFENHRLVEQQPWSAYFKPARPEAIPVDDHGLIAVALVN